MSPGRRALLVAALAVPGCAAPPMTAALRETAAASGSADRLELETTPFFAQTRHHCGPAALATVLRTAGIDADPERLAEHVFVPARAGSLQVEMLAAARRAGAVAVPLPGTLAALFDELKAGTPVVVLQNLGLSFAPRWHYAVLIGYDLSAGDVVLRSGTTRRATMPLGTFERTWSRAGHWAFVALPPGRLSASATESATTEALIGFERVADPVMAARAYAAASARWPASLPLAIGLGNTLFAARRFHDAAIAYERAAQQHESAAAWSNLAYARLALGQRDAARAAAERAVERARSAEPHWLDRAKEALAKLEAIR